MLDKHRETIFAFAFSLIIIIITWLPIHLKASYAPNGTFYPYIHNSAILQDYYSDLALIRQGKTVFQEIDPYTSERINPTWIHIYYLTAGKIGGFLGLSDISIYYLSAYGTLIPFFVFLNLLVRLIIPKAYQLLCLFIVYFASPLPPYTFNLFGKNIFLGDSWWTNMNVDSRFLMRPLHFSGVTILVICTYFFIRFYRTQKYLYSFICAIMCFIGLIISAVPELIFLAALAVVTIGLLFLFMQKGVTIFRKRILTGIGMIFLFALPALLYMRHLTSASYIGSIIGHWEFVTFQKENFPATIWVYLGAFGLLLPFALVSFPSILRRLKFEQILILLITILPIVFYLLSVQGIIPISKLRFLYSAPYLYGGILATLGIAALLRFIKNIAMKSIVLSCIFFMFIVNAVLGLYSYWWPSLSQKEFSYNTYIPYKYFSLFDYINTHVPKYSPMMTSFYTGMFVPSFADVKVFIGHETSTINFGEKFRVSEMFYKSALTLAEAQELFHTYKLEYVLWERYNPPVQYEPLLQKLYQIENLTLYKIKEV